MNFPLNVFLYLQKTPFLRYIFIILAKDSGFLLIFIYLFLLILPCFSKKTKFFSISVLTISLILSYGLFCLSFKSLIYSPRPFIVYKIIPFIKEGGNSFPSGHISFFFPISLAIYFLNKKWGIFSIILVILLGIGRVFVGVHYFSDILGAFLIGGLCYWISYKLLKRFL